MKLKICFLPLLCLIFQAQAQENKINSTGADSIKVGLRNLTSSGITIGQKVPNVLIPQIQNLRLNGQQVNLAHLADFKGKLLILDFWATWCSPCRAMVPVMDSLQKDFEGEVIFLPVSYESAAVVNPVIAQMKKVRNFNLPEVTGDKTLSKIFPHTALPHYVWIDGQGIVRAITEHQEVTAANIKKMLAGANTQMALKKDLKIPYNHNLPLFTANNGGDGATVVYHSLLAGYVPGLIAGNSVSAFDPVKGQKFTATNSSLIWLYRMAYGDQWFPNSQVRILSRDSVKITTKLTGQAYHDWLQAGNGWSYELQLPPVMAAKAYPIMQTELQRLFPAYTASVETQRVNCLTLIRLSEADKLKTKGGGKEIEIGPYTSHIRNAKLADLLLRLRRQYLQRYPLPIIDATGYIGNIDLDLDAPMNNVAAINKALKAYDLQFVEQTVPVDLLVIRDKPSSPEKDAVKP